MLMPTQKVRCGPHFHHIEWTPSGPKFAHHGSPAESVLHALGGHSGCSSRVEAWKRAGIELGEVHAWVTRGITDPFRAGRWRGFGFSPQRASGWEQAGFRSITDAYALWKVGVLPLIAEFLKGQGLGVGRIAACAGSGGSVDEALAWHATGLDTSVINLLRAGKQTPDTVDPEGKWVCSLCDRRFDPRRVLTHVGSQRCYQESGRSQADGWVEVPDRWTDVFGAWHNHHRSLWYSYRSHRNRYWVQSPFEGVDLPTVLAAITRWRQRHGGRWSAATEAVMGLSQVEVLRLVSPVLEVAA